MHQPSNIDIPLVTLVHLRQVHPLKLAGSMNSVGESTHPNHLCRSVKSVGGPLFAWLVHLRQVPPLKLAGSVKSVNSVGESTHPNHLCRSVKSVGEHPQQSEICGRHFAAAEARIPPLLSTHPNHLCKSAFYVNIQMF